MQTSPETETNRFTPLAIARRLAGYIARLSGFVEDYRETPTEAVSTSVIPDAVQQDNDALLIRDLKQAPSTDQVPCLQSIASRCNAHGMTTTVHMQLRYKQRFLTHIRRVEYTLRCYILWLAAQLIERGFVPSAPPERKSHPVPEQELTGLIRQQELELRRLTSETPRIGGFSVTTPDFSHSGKGSERRGLSFTPDPLSVVPIADLMARMARLPRALKRADLMAERLVWRALNCHPEAPRTITSDRAGAASPIQRIRLAGAQKSKRQPLFYKPFENWLPPEDLWASSEDEEERGDLNYLHHLAREGLNATGYGIPPPGADDTLPKLTYFQPPAIRPL
ncbi:hypothetical protein [Ponticaulis sp.]|uniref:hypothetical protein n=1 Tax=Ponticaulis sp. TaxID=2020902 RepID=UPI0026176397|nr:hypothetical protein [Ponticaulis sp.]MDF1681754.1 hypothetical protein [Ponticaulis sp.]